MKRVTLYLIIFISLCDLQVDAQNNISRLADSLHHVLKQSVPDTARAQTLISLGGLYGNNNKPDSGLFYLQQGLDIALKEKHTQFTIAAYNSIGNIHLIQSTLPLALRNFQDMLKTAKASGNNPAECMALQRIGKVFELQADYDQALEYYNQAYVLENSGTSNPSMLALILNNIGNIHSYKNELDSALDYQHQSLKIRLGLNPNNPTIGYSYNDIAFIYSRMDSADKAIEYYDRALQILAPLNRKWETSVISQNIASSYYQKGEYEKGIQYALQGLKAGQEIKANSTIYSNSGSLAQLYAAVKDYKNAYEYAQLSAQYADSVNNEAQAREIGRLESRLELEKKEAENTRQSSVIEQQQRTNIAIGIGLVIALVLSLFLFRGRQMVKKTNNELKLRNEQINQQKEEILTQSESLKEALEEIQQINEEIKVKHDELNIRNLVIEKKNSNIISSINYGSRIQNALLPFDEQISENFKDYFILFKPKNIVSGDFYWFEDLGDKQILASVDCTGHGVPGAFMSMLGVGALDDAVLRQGLTDPSEILAHLDKYILNVLQQEQTDNKDGMELSITVIDKNTKTLSFAGARHGLYYFQEHKDELIKGDHFGVGGISFRRKKAFKTKTLDISKPTTIYLYSDGYPDQFGGENNRKFMSKRLRRLIASIHTKPFTEQKDILESTLVDWMTDQKQVDDILVIGMKVS